MSVVVNVAAGGIVQVTEGGPTTDEIGAAITAALQPIREMIMAQSAKIQEYTGAVTSLLGDVSARLAALQEAVANPDDSSNLSPEAQAELDAALARLGEFRELEAIGDEDGDGTPAAPGATTDHSTVDGQFPAGTEAGSAADAMAANPALAGDQPADSPVADDDAAGSA